MLDFFIDNISNQFGGVFQQTIIIPMCTNCTPLLVGLFSTHLLDRLYLRVSQE
jgi:hypothetical protein